MQTSGMGRLQFILTRRCFRPDKVDCGMRVSVLTWCWLVTHCTSSQMAEDNDADTYLTTPELITKYGYPIEVHRVQTQDGYVLELHRIPHGRSWPAERSKPAVLIQHALLCSSFDWVVMGPDRAFGFILADAGYDVWLANARGNTYCRKHVSLDPSDPQFWQYSWHEMGTYDVPAQIDRILMTTGQQKLFYIGHSMGTTMFFVMLSQRPEYNEKIHAMIALAPVAFFTPTKNPYLHFIERIGERFLETLFRVIGLNEFLPQNGLLNPISIAACEFRQFDYGEEKNMELYGQAAPPRYNLSLTTAPVALYYSDNDRLAPVYNVNRVFSALPNVIRKFRVPLKTFNHVDFMWGKDANTLVFRDVINVMKQYGEAA